MRFGRLGVGNRCASLSCASSMWALCFALSALACNDELPDSRVAGKTSPLSFAEDAPADEARVTVTLTFDDQRISQSVLSDALRAAGDLKGTFFIISSFVNDAPGDPRDDHPEKLSLDQLLDLERDGHEIAAHTRTHVELPSLSPDAQSDEICGSMEELTSFGLGAIQPIVSFAYPYGDYDDGVEQMVEKCGFSSARSVEAGPERMPPRNAFATRTRPKGGSITKDDSVASIQGWVSNADPGDWLQLIFHDIASDEYAPSDEYYQTLEDFNVLLDFLANEVAEGHIAVKTVAQVMRASARGKRPD